MTLKEGGLYGDATYWVRWGKTRDHKTISLSHGVVSQSGTFSRTTTPNVAADTAGGRRDHDDDRYENDGEVDGVSHGEMIMRYFVDDIGPPSRSNADFPARSTLPTVWDALMPGDHRYLVRVSSRSSSPIPESSRDRREPVRDWSRLKRRSRGRFKLATSIPRFSRTSRIPFVDVRRHEAQRLIFLARCLGFADHSRVLVPLGRFFSDEGVSSAVAPLFLVRSSSILFDPDDLILVDDLAMFWAERLRRVASCYSLWRKSAGDNRWWSRA